MDIRSEPPLHVSISGDLGSGKSTVARLVAERLGATVVSTGSLHRDIASSLNLSAVDANLLAEVDGGIDSRIDGVTAELSESAVEPIVFDSRMAWYILRSSLKVRLLVDPEIAIGRILERPPNDVEGYSSASDARRRVRQRYNSEVRRFLARYDVDITALKQFDLVVDTSDAPAVLVADEIVRRYLATHRSREVLVSPKRIVPAFLVAPVEERCNDVDIGVVYSRPFFFAVCGAQRLAEAVQRGAQLVRVVVVAEGAEMFRPGLAAQDFPRCGANLAEVDAWANKLSLDFSSFKFWLQDSEGSES